MKYLESKARWINFAQPIFQSLHPANGKLTMYFFEDGSENFRFGNRGWKVKLVNAIFFTVIKI